MGNNNLLRTLWIVFSVLVAQTTCYVITDSHQDLSKSVNSITSNVPSSVPPINNSVKSSSTSSSDNNNSTAYDDSASQQVELEQYWLNQREYFFNITTFNLTKKTNDFVGEEHGNRTYHLPFWFSYEMFKNLTDRAHADPDTALKRHHIFIDNCVFIWKNNAFKRLHRPNNFTFIDHAEDWTQTENYNEEWNEISLNLTALERRENPIAKGVRLVQEELSSCTNKKDKNLCILLLIDLDERFGPAMKLRYPYEEERYRNLLDIDAAEEAAAEFADSLLSSDGRFSYWIDRRDQFFKNTTFTLSDKVRKLIGSPYGAPSKSYHLPFWFDYEVFKRMVSRINETPQEELKSHHKYIDSCLEIWNDTASERLGQLDYEAGGITSHVDIPARTCLYNCNPFDYDLTEEEVRETPTEKALRLVQEEIESASSDRKRTILLLVELEEKFDFPRARGMRYPFEPERTHEDFWKYIEDRDKAISDFVKSIS